MTSSLPALATAMIWCGRGSSQRSSSAMNGWRVLGFRRPRRRHVLARRRRKSECRTAMTYGNEDVISISHGAQQDLLPPLVSALKAAADMNAASFHFPGHNRGRAAPSSLVELIGRKAFLHDLPELPELDNLFAPEGPILEAQKLAAELFGAVQTWFLVGGTTCGIQAAIMATCSPGDVLILPRNSHISAISALVLTGVVPKYIMPDYDLELEIAGTVTSSQVGDAINDLKVEGRNAAAVFITCPTYHGICSNLKEIAEVCHSQGVPLIVDEAHGAHFGFHPQLPSSALHQGADISIQSTHKVLCSLTQSSMLHMAGKLVDKERISRCLQTLQSTSPSYLLLASLDAARSQLSKSPEAVFHDAIQLANEAKSSIRGIHPLSVLDSARFSKSPAIDPLRITVGVKKLGLSGYEADEFLSRDQNVVSELVGSHSITFVFTPGTCMDHVQSLVLGLERLSTSMAVMSDHSLEKTINYDVSVPFSDIRMELNPREAFFAGKRKISFQESIGKVSGELICPYPPGIPVLAPGEIITQGDLDCLLRVRSMGGFISGASDPCLSSIVICDV
ncbi:hypothetical protein Droror1_Dr00017049 [Drosera rotundifolia]